MKTIVTITKSIRLLPVALGAFLLGGGLRAQVAPQSQMPNSAATADQGNPPPAAQSEEPVKLSDFVVSTNQDSGYRATNTIAATHIDTPIKDVPFNMQVIMPSFMKDIAAFDVQTALEYVPGVTAATDTGASIRGFQANWTQRDGFQWLDPDDVVNVDRIEVVRGPSAVLYGQGQPGGFVNYVTKTPVFGRQIQDVQLTFGSFDYKRASVDYNTSSGPVAVRVLAAGYSTHSYGFPTVSHPNEHNRMQMVEPVVSFKLPTNTVITLDAEYALYERTKPNGILTQSVNGSSVPLPVLYGINPFMSWNGPQQNDENSIRNLMAVVDQKLNDQLSFRFGFNWYSRTDHQIYGVNPAVATGDPANPGVTEIRGQWLNKQNGNANYSWRGDLLYKFDLGPTKNQVLAGFWRNDYRFKQSRMQDMVFNPGYTPPSGPAPDPYQNIAYYQGIFSNSSSRFVWYGITDPNPNLSRPAVMNWLWNPAFFLTQDQKEQYLYATYQGRYFNDKIITLIGVSHSSLVQVNTSPGNNPPQNHTTIASGTQTSPLIGAIYRPVEPLSLYVLTSSSLQLNSGQDGHGNWLPPRKGVSYEGGAKLDFWNGRLSGTVSVYEIIFKNRVQFDPNATNYVDPTLTGANVLIGEDTSKGVDLDLLANPVDGWQIVFGYSHINEYISKDLNPANVGRRGNGVVPNQWKIWNNYEFRHGPLTGFSAGLGVIWYDRTLLSYIGANPSMEKAYYTADARIGYTHRWGRRDWSVSLNAKNLVRAPMAVGYNAANSYTPYYFNTPTTYYLSVGLDF